MVDSRARREKVQRCSWMTSWFQNVGKHLKRNRHSQKAQDLTLSSFNGQGKCHQLDISMLYVTWYDVLSRALSFYAISPNIPKLCKKLWEKTDKPSQGISAIQERYRYGRSESAEGLSQIRDWRHMTTHCNARSWIKSWE